MHYIQDVDLLLRLMKLKIFRKKIACFIIAMICYCLASGQVGFNKIIELRGSGSANFDGIKYFDNKIYVVGNTLIDSLLLWGQSIAIIDTFGNLLFQKTFLDDSNSHIVNNSPSGFLLTKNKNVVIPYYLYNRNKLGILIIDSLGNEKLMVEFPNSEYTIYPGEIQEFGDDIYLFGKIQRLTDQNDVYVIKTNLAGDFKWIKYYGSSVNNDYFGNVIDNKNGTFTISSATATPEFSIEPYGSKGWKQPWIFTIDTSGNKVWEWRGLQNDSNTLGGGPIYKMKNGDWIVISQEYKENNQHQVEFSASAPTITKFDSLFNKQWKLYLSNYTGYWDKLLALEFDSTNNEFVAGGHRVFYYSFNNGELEAWIVKFTPDGQITLNTSDTIWSDPINGVRHFTSGLTLSPSGSIYMDGYVVHEISPFRQYGWILKMTPDGCIDTICLTTPAEEPVSDPDELIIFPNPAFDHISIKLPVPLLSLDMYNLTGSLVHSVFPGESTNLNMDTHSLANGIYLVSARKKDGTILTRKFIINH